MCVICVYRILYYYLRIALAPIHTHCYLEHTLKKMCIMDLPVKSSCALGCICIFGCICIIFVVVYVFIFAFVLYLKLNFSLCLSWYLYLLLYLYRALCCEHIRDVNSPSSSNLRDPVVAIMMMIVMMITISLE